MKKSALVCLRPTLSSLLLKALSSGKNVCNFDSYEDCQANNSMKMALQLQMHGLLGVCESRSLPLQSLKDDDVQETHTRLKRHE